MKDVIVDLYICTPKVNNDTDAYADWNNAITNASENMLAGAITSANYGLKPTMFTAFNKKWSTKVVSMKLLPGQTYEHFIKAGPLCMDYKKFLNVSTNWNFPKGVGLSCFTVQRNVGLIPDTANYSSHSAGAVTVANAAAITCELKYVFVINAPELCDDSQKFEKFCYNAYNQGAGAPYSINDYQASAYLAKKVFAKAPQSGAITAV